MTAAQRRRPTALFASAAVLLGAAACSSSSGGVPPGPGGLSYDTVRTVAEKLLQDQAAGKGKEAACPFGLDLGKALKAAGIPGTPALDTGDEHAVDGDIGNGESPQPWPSGMSHPPEMPSIPAKPPLADVSCGWRVGSAKLDLELLATTQRGVAVNLMLPGIQHAARLGASDLQQLAADQPGPGQTKLLAGRGTAALSRITPKGDGDIVLLVSQNYDAQPDEALTGEPLRKLAESLAGQLR
ncbi:hypothetical protein ATKI12_1837 [Kitasatospora sp. Ki12]